MNAESIAAIVISVVSIIFSVVTYMKTVVHDRKRDTLDAYNRLQNEALDHLNQYLPAKMKEIASGSTTSPEYKEISGYIARIEHFCAGVTTRIYDKKVVYELAHGYLDKDTILNRINPFLEKKNKADEYYNNIPIVIQMMRSEEKDRQEKQAKKLHHK